MMQQQQHCKRCESILHQFITYRTQSVAEKETMKKEVQKCRQQIDKFVAKIDKRVQARVKDEQNVSATRNEQLEQLHDNQMQKYRALALQKDKVIEEMRHLLRALEAEKRQLIQNNTKVLVELSQGIDHKGQQPSEVLDQNYKELLKMYQFLIEENNELKKQIYSLNRHTFTSGSGNKNESFVLKAEEKSISHSQYKVKSITDTSKLERSILGTKTQTSKEKGKEKGKRPPTQKQPRK